MKRRTVAATLTALVGRFSILRANAAATPKGTSQIVIGAWAFALPSDWALDQKHEPNAPYFQSSDGTKGCYVNSLKPNSSPSRTPVEIATEVQQIHKKSFESNPDSKWRVEREEHFTKGGFGGATLDIFDREKKYHIMINVLAQSELAVLLTLHNYYCENYDASARYFSSIAESLHAR